jgi:ribonuclease Z
MKFELTILGCNSAIPTSNRFPTAQVLNILEHFFLIDCGEGAQMQLRKYRVKIQRIDHIFISHLHGDHYFGLIGLLSTMHLLGRKEAIHIFANADLEKILELQMKVSDTRLNFELIFHPLQYNHTEMLLDTPFYSVETILLEHRIPCCGFLFREKEKLKSLRKDKLKEFNVPVSAMQNLREGKDFITSEGMIIPNAEITVKPPVPRAYAYCSDTAYNEKIIEQIRGVDLLYHEATFGQEKLERAKETFHSTALQAATIAQKAAVKKLIIGHYSARYVDVTPLVNEAQSVFPETIAGEEGLVYEVKAVSR